ncbi:MAG: dephospho-CoA kinase [Anaerolineae bacterium]|nr:dephospho-CoA kinase [Anaerolineae bacterium]
MSRFPNKYVIGLTGNIGVGKSVVRQMAQHLGAYPIDADSLAHQAMAPGAPAHKPIVHTFGQVILNPDQTINRSMLGQIVFGNPALLTKLEEITHPVIRQAIVALVTRAKQRVIIVEAIKLLEGDLVNVVDEIWVVDAKPETQYKRLIEKRKMSADEARRRILAQNPQSDKLKRANVVINNDSDIEQTWKQVQAAWNTLTQKFAPEPTPTPVVATPAPTPTPVPAATPTMPTPAPDNAQSMATKPLTQAVNLNAPIPTPITPAARAMDDDDEIAPLPQIDTTGVQIKRGMPNNAEQIAQFINRMSGQTLSRMDVMMAFGQKSYLVATNTSDQLIGLAGWQVENLITRVDEFYLDPTVRKDATINAILAAMEQASRELQSEVGFVFLPINASAELLQIFADHGYTVTTPKEMKVPAWREALQEVNLTQQQILHKRLRKDRVLKPI